MSESTAILHVSHEQRAAMLHRVRELMATGTDPDEIAGQLGVNAETFRALYVELQRRDAEVLKLSPEKHFTQYVSGALMDIRDLSKLLDLNIVTAQVETADGMKAQPVVLDPKAAASFIKARHEIRRAIIEVGQDLNLIRRAPQRVEHTVSGVPVSQMDRKELRKILVDLARDLKDEMTAFDGELVDVDFEAVEQKRLRAP